LLAFPVPPAVELMAPVVLAMLSPPAVPATVTDNVQVPGLPPVPAGIVPLDRETEEPLGLKVPPQVFVTVGDADTATPAGNGSENATPVKATEFVAGLLRVKLRVLLAPRVMVVGVKALVIVAGAATISVAACVGLTPVPPLVEEIKTVPFAPSTRLL
jgi:hypothetical protein